MKPKIIFTTFHNEGPQDVKFLRVFSCFKLCRAFLGAAE